jgi:hypothetical protein
MGSTPPTTPSRDRSTPRSGVGLHPPVSPAWAGAGAGSGGGGGTPSSARSGGEEDGVGGPVLDFVVEFQAPLCALQVAVLAACHLYGRGFHTVP